MDPRQAGRALRAFTDTTISSVLWSAVGQRHAVGSQLREAVLAAGKTGRVLTFGLNDRASVILEPSILAYKEISIHGIYIAKGTFPLAIDLLADDRLGFGRLITRSYPLEDIAQAIDDMRSGTVAKALLRP